jgi:4-alpha-glucanotransferase
MESSFQIDRYRCCVTEGLKALGVDNLFLQIHDPSFPSFDDEEIGRGSPYTRGAANFIQKVRNFGFNGIQLGPQGMTSKGNQSPYDGTVFSRNPLSISLGALRDSHLLTPEQLEQARAGCPADRDRVQYQFAYDAMGKALNAAYENFDRLRAERDAETELLAERLADFQTANSLWLERDALYGALFEAHGGQSWRQWTDEAGPAPIDRRLWNAGPVEEAAMRGRRAELAKRHAKRLERYGFIQLLAHEQHARLRAYCGELNLKLYADLQIGVSDQDAWSYGSLFLRGYRMGAPPSRTNPDGQPWGFMVLDPKQYHDGDGGEGPVLRFLNARMRKVHAEYDGVRVDHPQGWTAPWVYRSDIADPFEAVQNGARLFSAPDLPDHPRLRQFALSHPDQLDRSVPRHSDNWVKDLTEEQVTRYATLFTHLAPRGIEGQHEVMCEVLSTMPYPLRRVMERYGLGRFRVLQNANPNDPYDVYRSDNAQPSDWIMLGNHDTRPIWRLARKWCESGEARDRAADLAQRLMPYEAARPGWIEHFATRPGALVHALFADMLHSKARNIMVFVSDMLGVEQRYNTPGTVSDDNWSLRVPPDFEGYYLSRTAEDRALNLPYAMLLALKARSNEMNTDLIQAVEMEDARLRAAGRAYAYP